MTTDQPLTTDLDIADTANAMHALEQRAQYFKQQAMQQVAENQMQATKLSELFSKAADVVEQMSRGQRST